MVNFGQGESMADREQTIKKLDEILESEVSGIVRYLLAR